jgi:hypothetical protein
MTQKEKEQKQIELMKEYSDLKTRLEMLEDERRALEATPIQQEFKAWEPEENTKVWDAGTLEEIIFPSFECAYDLVNAGLYHPTKEAAERHHQFLVMLHELHKFAVEHNEEWTPDWGDIDSCKWHISMYNGMFQVESWECRIVNILPCFKSSELALKAVNTFGDRLKILFTYYNS